MPLDVDEDGNDIFRFGTRPQNAFSTASNNEANLYRKWNHLLRVGFINQLADALNFVHQNDANNVYQIDYQTLNLHHQQVRWLYELDTELYHQPRSTDRPPFERLTTELWEARREQLENRFDGSDFIELPVTGGISLRGQMTALVGTNLITNRLPMDQYSPIREVWVFFQQFLIPGVSSIYMREIEPNIFRLYVETTYSDEINVSEREAQDYGDYPQNWLYYGAPGTGKSHDLENKAKRLVRQMKEMWISTISHILSVLLQPTETLLENTVQT